MSRPEDLRIQALAARQLVAELQAADEALSDEDAECAISSETTLPEAIEATLLANAEDEAHAEALKALVARLSERAARKLERVQRRRFAILAALEMAGLRKLELAAATVSVGKGSPRVLVTDQAALPEKFLRQKVELKPDLKLLAEALKDGPVEGAVLSNAIPTLTVRIR